MLLIIFACFPALVSAPKVPESALVALRNGERLFLTRNEIIDVADPSMILDADCLSSKCWPAVVEPDELAVYADGGARLGSKKSMSLLKYWGEGKSISHPSLRSSSVIHDSLLYVLFALTGTDAHFFAYVADRKLHAIAAPARAGADRIPRETAGFDDGPLLVSRGSSSSSFGVRGLSSCTLLVCSEPLPSRWAQRPNSPMVASSGGT